MAGKGKKSSSELKTSASRRRAFTVKQQRLIDAYDGDIKAAAKKAKISYGYARQLLTKSNILQAIKNRQETEVRPKTIADRQRRQEFWTQVMEDEEQDMRDRLKASELLGKSEADFTENLTHRFPEGCGVMLVGGTADPKQWQKRSREHHRKHGGNGRKD